MTYLLYYFNKYIPVKFTANTNDKRPQLLNTYLLEKDDDEFCWYMVYRFSGDIDFCKFEDEIFKNKYYVNHRDVDSSGKYVIYKFNIPEELIDILTLFLNGKYSRMPEISKLICYVMSMFKINFEHDLIKVLRRDETLRLRMEEELNEMIDPEQDLSSIPDLELETYYHNICNQKSQIMTNVNLKETL